MDTQNKLYVTITDERSNGYSSFGGGNAKSITPKNRQGGYKPKEEIYEGGMIGRYAEHELFHIVKNTSTQLVDYQISNVGNLTGDYITQRKLNVVRQASSDMVGLTMSTISFAKIGGVVGAVFGFTLGAISNISSACIQDMQTRNEMSKTNFNIDQLRMRAGLNTTRDESRGTEN